MDEQDREPQREEDDEREAFDAPPEGAMCAEHPERIAIAVCPRCGAYACVSCWHHTIRRCHACLMQDPGAAAPPIPWEVRSNNIVSRFVGTLATAARPDGTAPAFGRGTAREALGFAIASFVPLALLGRIVAYTHTLLFGPALAIRLLGTPTEAEIAVDVVRASLLGLGIAIVMIGALAVSYRSLALAYAHKGHDEAPLRVVLYRAWLLPASFVLGSLAAWIAPAPVNGEPGTIALMLGIVQVVPVVLLFSSLRATARMGSGAGVFSALVVALVPFLLMLLVEYFAEIAMTPFLPDPEVLRAFVEASGAGSGAE